MNILKVRGLSGEVDHYIVLDRTDRIDIKQVPNCTAYRFYAHGADSDLDIMIARAEADKIRMELQKFM